MVLFLYAGREKFIFCKGCIWKELPRLKLFREIRNLVAANPRCRETLYEIYTWSGSTEAPPDWDRVGGFAPTPPPSSRVIGGLPPPSEHTFPINIFSSKIAYVLGQGFFEPKIGQQSFSKNQYSLKNAYVPGHKETSGT